MRGLSIYVGLTLASTAFLNVAADSALCQFAKTAFLDFKEQGEEYNKLHLCRVNPPLPSGARHHWMGHEIGVEIASKWGPTKMLSWWL